MMKKKEMFALTPQVVASKQSLKVNEATKIRRRKIN